MGRHSKPGKQNPKKQAKKKQNRAHGSSKGPQVAPTSLYGVLEVAVDADVEKIREQYLHMIRQFPPETHPDKFQTIRAAYDILKDTESRRQYDRERFYGSSLSDLRSEVHKLLAKGRGQDAIRIMHQIVDIKPSVEDYLNLVEEYQNYGQLKAATDAYQQALDLAPDPQEKVRVGMKGAHLVRGLYDYDYDQEVIDALRRLAEQYPQVAPPLVAPDIFRHYCNMGQFRRAMAYFRSLIPRRKYLTAEDFAIYIVWLTTLYQERFYDEFDQLLESKVKPAAITAARGPHRDKIVAMLLERTQVANESLDWRVQAITANLAHLADPTNETARKLWREYAEKYLLRSQIEDLIVDLRIPTTVVHQVLEGLIDKHQVKYTGVMGEDLKMRPRTVETLSEVAAIDFIKDVYPRVYRAFKPRLLSWTSSRLG